MSSIFDALKKLEGEKSADRGGGLKRDLFRLPPPRGGGKRFRSALIGVAVLLLGGGAALLWSRSEPEPPVEAQAPASTPDQPVSVGTADASREEARTAGAEGAVSAADRLRREQLLTRYRALQERREGSAGEVPAGAPRLVQPPEGLLTPPVIAFPIHEKPAADRPLEPSPEPRRIARAPAVYAPEAPKPEPPAPEAGVPETPPAPPAEPAEPEAAPPSAAPAPEAAAPEAAAPEQPPAPPAEPTAPEAAPAPAASPPAPAAPERVARAKAESPGATPEAPAAGPAPAAPEIGAPDKPPPPLVVESAGPSVTLTEVTYHSSRDRRSAYLRVGDAKPRRALEGETLEGIEVREILPGAVIVLVAGHEVTLDVGESVSLTVTRQDFH